MLTIANKKPISVGILEISSQNKAILEYFFSNAGKKSFKEVGLDQASAYIIDYDSPGARDSWETIYKETQKPGIIISIKPVDLPSCIWLPKPLTVKALTDAGVSIREMILQLAEDTEKLFSAPVVTTPTDENSNKIDDMPSKEESIEKSELLDDSIFNEQNTSLKDKEATQTQEETELAIAEPNIALKEESFEFDELLENSTKNEEKQIETVSLEITGKNGTSVTSKKDMELRKEPELALVETTTASSSTLNFEVSPNLLDIDLKLNDSDSTAQDESGSKVVAEPESSILNKDANVENNVEEPSDSSEMDFLLDTLISGGTNSKTTDETVEKPSVDKETNASGIDNRLAESDLDSLYPLENDLDKTSIVDTSSLDLELEIVAATEVATNDDIDIINLEPKKPIIEPNHNMPIITDDGSSMNLQNSEGTQENIEEVEEKIFNSMVIDETSSKKEIDSKLDIDVLLPTKATTTSPKKTAEEELQSLLEEIRQEADESSKEQEESKSANKKTAAEGRWIFTCGENEDTDDLKTLCTLTPSNHMLATLLETIEKANWSKQVLRLKLNNTIIVIEPSSDRIYCDRSIFSEQYANTCFESFEKSSIKIHELDTSEIRMYRKKMNTDKERTHSFEAFIWTTSLLTARGRLPVGTDINANVGLKYWPNLTRVENTPHMMQVAAILNKKSNSLLSTPQELGIPQKYVIAFYNAALSLDIIKMDATAEHSSLIDKNEGDNKNRGFFSRLLKRISS